MYILAMGASRNIGYLSCLRLLAEGHSVTFLLRTPSVFANDTEIQKYIQEGRVKCVQGDATVRTDVERALDAARVNGQLDFVLFSVGGTPGFSPLSGFIINPPNLCSSSLYNVLVSYPEEISTSPQPKLVVISSNGLTKSSHSTLPLLLKPLFSYALRGPHADKLVMERAIFHAADWAWPEEESKETAAKFLGSDWQSQMKDSGYLKEIAVIRPSLLLDGDKKPAKGIYRTSTGELSSAYSITRKDVAHFVVEGVVKNWDLWRGKVISISE